MPTDDKSAYTDKQKRKAEHIFESEKERSVSEEDAERIAWATVNKQDGGGKKQRHQHQKEKYVFHILKPFNEGFVVWSHIYLEFIYRLSGIKIE